MFQVNDTVSYGTHGVCQITEIGEKNLTGKSMEYYILKPVYNENSTLYVPVHSENLTGKMRRILSVREIREMIRQMPYHQEDWIDNENLRKTRYRELLTDGNRTELLKMLRTLYLHQQEQISKGKKLHNTDERFFREAEKLLFDEIALVLHIKPSQVLPFILEQIQATDNGQKEVKA
ncbi:CarD family transcriptional regulator [Diplocloster modestus]|uniref:CarD family transcriptional regulator n=1 Tax=Diplocloster modestus TaxID=2850322 RepID=A0ABS6KAA7_9FIRM|nr:CarD family transcriptional regulator [Diplocloster modestus]MBU9727449.1 CarD family transcriptional regulator [Diplocloster modestus]